MSTPAPTTPLTRFGRRQTKGLLLGYSGPVVITVGGGVLLLTVSVFLGSVRGVLLTLPVWGTLIAAGFVRWQGAPVIESVPIVAHWQLRKATGQTRYRIKANAPRPAGTMGLPGDAAALRFHTDPATGAVMVHDPHRQSLAAVVKVSHPAFVLLDASEQTRRIAGWSRVLSGLASTGTCAAVQVLESVTPDPGRGVVGWWREHGNHDGGWAATEYESLMSAAAPSASAHRTLITLSLDLKHAAKSIKEAGPGLTGAAAVLAGDMANLDASLRTAGLHVDGWQSAAELAAVIRQAYDPELALAAGDPGASLALGPAAIDEAWDHLHHDSGYSTVLWISDWPTTEVTASFLHSLIFAAGVRRNLSLIAKPLGAAEAMRAIRKEKVDYIADHTQKAKTGRIIDHSDEQEYADVLARERALVSGHADMRYSGFITLTATSLAELRSAVARTQRVANQCMLETRILYGRQAQGFTVSALPLGRTVG